MGYTVITHRAEEGGYWVEVPALPGCVSQAETVEEALAHVREAIETHLDALREDGQQAPQEEELFVGRVEVPSGEPPEMRALHGMACQAGQPSRDTGEMGTFGLRGDFPRHRPRRCPGGCEPDCVAVAGPMRQGARLVRFPRGQSTKNQWGRLCIRGARKNM